MKWSVRRLTFIKSSPNKSKSDYLRFHKVSASQTSFPLSDNANTHPLDTGCYRRMYEQNIPSLDWHFGLLLQGNSHRLDKGYNERIYSNKKPPQWVVFFNYRYRLVGIFAFVWFRGDLNAKLLSHPKNMLPLNFFWLASVKKLLSVLLSNWACLMLLKTSMHWSLKKLLSNWADSVSFRACSSL